MPRSSGHSSCLALIGLGRSVKRLPNRLIWRITRYAEPSSRSRGTRRAISVSHGRRLASISRNLPHCQPMSPKAAPIQSRTPRDSRSTMQCPPPWLALPRSLVLHLHRGEKPEEQHHRLMCSRSRAQNTMPRWMLVAWSSTRIDTWITLRMSRAPSENTA